MIFTLIEMKIKVYSPSPLAFVIKILHSMNHIQKEAPPGLNITKGNNNINNLQEEWRKNKLTAIEDKYKINS